MRESKNYLTGISGEFYVAARLAQLGWSVLLPVKNLPEFDFMAWKNGRSIRIQVKTAWEKTSPSWMMNKRHEEINDKDLFYIFVWLKESPEFPRFWVVPSRIVASFLYRDHRRWLASPGKRVRKRKDNSVRVFKALGRFRKYEDAWEMLESEKISS